MSVMKGTRLEEDSLCTRDSSNTMGSASHSKRAKSAIEKRRRARINGCLEQLKELVLQSAKDSSSSSKLEKADILEMTLHHVKSLTKLADSSSACSKRNGYRDGYSECARVIQSFLSENTAEKQSRGLLTSVLNRLKARENELLNSGDNIDQLQCLNHEKHRLNCCSDSGLCAETEHGKAANVTGTMDTFSAIRGVTFEGTCSEKHILKAMNAFSHSKSDELCFSTTTDPHHSPFTLQNACVSDKVQLAVILPQSFRVATEQTPVAALLPVYNIALPSGGRFPSDSCLQLGQACDYQTFTGNVSFCDKQLFPGVITVNRASSKATQEGCDTSGQNVNTTGNIGNTSVTTQIHSSMFPVSVRDVANKHSPDVRKREIVSPLKEPHRNATCSKVWRPW